VTRTNPVDNADLRRRVEVALAGFLGTARARLDAIDAALTPLADAIDGLVLGGGKRLRPAFAYWGFRGAGGDDDGTRRDVVAAVASLELVQASALIHDDLMDASDTRRGEPSMHRRFARHHRDAGWHGRPDAFGEAAAILGGDLCLVWSDEMLHTSGLAAEALRRARPVFDEMRTEVTVGQYLDVLNQVTGDTSVARASKVATYKSAKYTVERPLEFGAALAGASPDVLGAFAVYGLALGEAFQLRDDVLGVYGDPAETGKPAGDDLREGKRTYLVAAAHEAGDAVARKILAEDLGDRELDAERVDRLREIIAATGALARTESRIDELTEVALRALGGVDLAGGAGEVLTALAEASTRRQH
jgi:geranylgeranyl diphosphate synthase type I